MNDETAVRHEHQFHQVARRRELYWQPYHAQLRAELDAYAKGKVLHADYKVKSSGDAERVLALLQ